MSPTITTWAPFTNSLLEDRTKILSTEGSLFSHPENIMETKINPKNKIAFFTFLYV
jgi:hypothetical protein